MPKPPNSYNMEIISIEDIKLDTPYTLTINPCDDHQYFKLDFLSRIESCKTFMQHAIDNISATPIILYPEISPKGRFHWHGKITFKHDCDVLKFYISHIPQLLSKCSIEIDSIETADKWDTYIKKQQRFFDWNIRNYSLLPPSDQVSKFFKKSTKK